MTIAAGPDRAAEPDQPWCPGARRYPAARRIGGLTVAAALIAVPLLAGCGSRQGAATAAATARTCAQVSATLSDGPDADADPVGYAEAQIQPLRAIQTPNQALHSALGDLATAYARVFASNGKSLSADKAVTTAGKKVAAICPGATA